ncbi:YeeE/YedE thiosulfate transporter family protein [Plantactinospora sp. WMMC1484]|uniref:YeeE/YedE family protein n=1 Tax=Plantactinospora sp. WMMC1484 TaxID=3404122 RepID=UPI003BF5857B
MSDYWPWWAGALGLALVTINYTVSTDRSFGVSSAWERVLHWRNERRVERMEAQFTDDRALTEALAAATAEHFGTRTGAAAASSTAVADGTVADVAEVQASAPVGEPAATTPTPTSISSASASPRPAPLATQAALLLSIFMGGLLAAVTAGRFDLRLDMGDGFRDIVTDSPLQMVGVLFAGGILVGFGTRLAGGCSSGHGLNGCGRLHPDSLVATAVFFGAAVVVSFLLWKVI